MGKMKTLLTALAGNPVYTIGVILAVALLLFGLYSVGPWYTSGAGSVITKVFEGQIVRSGVSILYMIPPIAMLVGIRKKSWRRWATFGTFLSYLFLALLRLITFGPVPMIWLFILACGLATGIVYLHVSMKEDNTGAEDGLL